MIGLDTNVQVRHIIQDDVAQSKQASDLMDSQSADAPGFIGLVALIELVWVLSSCFGLRRVSAVSSS